MSRIVSVTSEYMIFESEENLQAFCNFDMDLNGENGKDYTMEEAINEGFDTSAQYIFAKAKETCKKNNLKDLANEIGTRICNTDESYLNHKVIDLEDGRYLIFINIAISF